MKNKNAPSFFPAGKDQQNDHRRTLCYTAGRSGGHILPALTNAQEHKKLHPEDRIVFITTHTKLDTDILSNVPYIARHMQLRLGNVPRSVFMLPVFAVALIVAFVRSLFFLRSEQVTTIISMGGYVSIPVCLAAYCLRIPIEIFELNAVPGRATRFLAAIAQKVFVCFDRTRAYFPTHASRIVYPLRYQMAPLASQVLIHMRQHHLMRHKKTVLLLGGSQGSLFLNRLMGRWVQVMPHVCEQIQIVHQTGAQDNIDWRQWYHDRGVAAVVFPYAQDLSLWYACADLIVCRAGAGTLFEVAFFKKRCLIVPLVTRTTAHQIDNAQAMAEQYPDLFYVVDQKAVEHDEMVLFKKLNIELCCDE